MNKATNEMSALGFSIAEAAKAAGIGRSTLYEELASGKLTARELGRRTIIPATDLSAWLANLPTLRP